MLRDVFLPFAPRRVRGKHELTFAPLKDPASFAKLAENLYYGDVLHELVPGAVQKPISATSEKRGRPALLIASFEVHGRPSSGSCAPPTAREKAWIRCLPA